MTITIAWGLLAFGEFCLIIAGIQLTEAVRIRSIQVDHLRQANFELRGAIELRDKQIASQHALLSAAEAWIANERGTKLPPAP